ncbi:hypothetical protein AEYBE204_07590 [Asticcacaulis sp. YBE204]|nr:hypothetical protein AEYBE204_07590 [Asticcacaulis sp. YBE204]
MYRTSVCEIGIGKALDSHVNRLMGECAEILLTDSGVYGVFMKGRA